VRSVVGSATTRQSSWKVGRMRTVADLVRPKAGSGNIDEARVVTILDASFA
jgi:hypothetical protein